MTSVYVAPSWGMLFTMFLHRLWGFAVTLAVVFLIWKGMDKWQR